MEIGILHRPKSNERKQALQDLFLITSARKCGILGRNSAGKTNLMRILETLQNRQLDTVLLTEKSVSLCEARKPFLLR